MFTSLAPSPIATQILPLDLTKFTILAFYFGVLLAQITESAFIKIFARRVLSLSNSLELLKMKSKNQSELKSNL